MEHEEIMSFAHVRLARDILDLPIPCSQRMGLVLRKPVLGKRLESFRPKRAAWIYASVHDACAYLCAERAHEEIGPVEPDPSGEDSPLASLFNAAYERQWELLADEINFQLLDSNFLD